MVFFDFNIPYLEGGGVSVSNKGSADSNNSNARKNARLKITVKAMELGFSGVAYNRTIKGVMSDSDKCAIAPFPISSLLKLAPSLEATVKFHRDVLGVSLNAPFRQYRRLTVTVDSMIQISALNSGNPVLKSYDLVAVRPMNQLTFDHACKVSEVDLIAIDFSLKLPFRLKLPMVKAATERGVYFEITYSPLISDVQTRRQVVANAKLLVDWTRGKNLILSSGAASVNDIRGPYDVANLSSLIGLSMERAKAAISKNCRSLIANALRKKQFYKDAIKIERISSAEQKDSKEPWFVNLPSWDHISSSGDLRLEDIVTTTLRPETSKAIDFASIAEETPSSGMRLKDWLSSGDKLPMDGTSPLPSEAKESADTEKDIRDAVPQNDTPGVIAHGKNIETSIPCHEEPKCSYPLSAVSVENASHYKPSQNSITMADQNHFLEDTVKPLSVIKDIERLDDIDVVLDTHDDGLEEIASGGEEMEQTDEGDVSVHTDFAPGELHRFQNNDLVLLVDENMLGSSYDERQNHVINSLADDMPSEGALAVQGNQKQETLKEIKRPSHKESKCGKARHKQRTYLEALPFRFKGLRNPVVFKKKSRKLKMR